MSNDSSEAPNKRKRQNLKEFDINVFFRITETSCICLNCSTVFVIIKNNLNRRSKRTHSAINGGMYMTSIQKNSMNTKTVNLFLKNTIYTYSKYI